MAAVKELLIELQEKYSVLDINEMMYPTPVEEEPTQELTQQSYENQVIDLIEQLDKLTTQALGNNIDIKDVMIKGIGLMSEVVEQHNHQEYGSLRFLEDVKSYLIKEVIRPNELEKSYVPVKVNVYGLLDEPFQILVSPYEMNTFERTDILITYIEENNIELPAGLEYRVEEVDDDSNGLDWYEETWYVITR